MKRTRGRPLIGDRPMTGAERVAARKQRLIEAGGRRVTLDLDADDVARLECARDKARAAGYRVESDGDALRAALRIAAGD